MAIYNPKSLKAEEFISDEEILDTLSYAKENKANKELIAEKEKMSLPKDASMTLYALQNAEILCNHRTLKEQGIQSGDKLILF